ncbi:MAG: hypothetical protein R3F59_19565, partial [Myxococcota bacterium]
MAVVPLQPDDRTAEAARILASLLGAVGPARLEPLAADAVARQRVRAGRTLADAALDVATCWLLDAGGAEHHERVLRAWAPKIAVWSRANAGRRTD